VVASGKRSDSAVRGDCCVRGHGRDRHHGGGIGIVVCSPVVAAVL